MHLIMPRIALHIKANEHNQNHEKTHQFNANSIVFLSV